jgi:hypothetical protein
MLSKKTIFIFLVALTTGTSCSKYLKSGNGGFSDVSLNRNSDEYTLKRLEPIELNGRSVFGIPGFGTNNKHKNKGGMIFRFNGVELGKVPRILPILTLLGSVYAYGALAQSIAGDKTTTVRSGEFTYSYSDGPKLKLEYACLIGLPLAGITNNLIWNGAALSGLTNQMYYKLVDENPDVDVFLNPKYKFDYKLGLFSQKATLNANVMGATLKVK